MQNSELHEVDWGMIVIESSIESESKILSESSSAD